MKGYKKEIDMDPDEVVPKEVALVGTTLFSDIIEKCPPSFSVLCSNLYPHTKETQIPASQTLKVSWFYTSTMVPHIWNLFFYDTARCRPRWYSYSYPPSQSAIMKILSKSLLTNNKRTNISYSIWRLESEEVSRNTQWTVILQSSSSPSFLN